ncbi:MAG TPA: ABC transporter substrate-binding protein [Methanomassiliicoccales archaeon]|nr:ABC transporter substrate-binding protein [Methanomassiliicoccales archaeon]
MEGSEIKPEAAAKGGMNIKLIAIIVVAVLVVAAVGAVLLMGGDEEPEPEATNWLDKGFKLELFYNSGNDVRALACQLMKQGLESLNPGKIEITATGVEWAQYLELRKNGAMPAMFLGWAPDYADPDNYVQPFYHSSGTYASMIGYFNSTLDTMIVEAQSILNTTDRAAAYEDMEMDMYEDCVFIWTAQATQFHAERSWISGYYFNPMQSGLIYNSFDKPDVAPAGAPSSYDGDTFVMATIDGNPESLDPAVGYETAGGEIMQNVYENLIFYNGTSASELIPVLATEVPTVDNGGISADGLQYIFHLKEDVVFHDGTDMTSEDVKYSLARALMLNDPHGPVWMLGQVTIPDYYDYDQGSYSADNSTFTPGIPADVIDDAIWASDDYTIQINLTSAYPAFLYVMAYNVGGVISKDYVELNGGMSYDGYLYMYNHMCGTGPYEFVDWQSSDYISMVRNDAYWDEPAAIKNVIIRQVADAATRILLLKAGDVDCAAIPRFQKADVEGVAGINITQGIGTFNVDFLGLNQALNLTALPNPEKTNVPMDFFADKNVRLAFAHAFDYATYIDSGLKGTAIQPNGPIPEGMFGYSANVPLYDFNLTKAADFLKASDVPAVDAGAGADTVLDMIIARIEI